MLGTRRPREVQKEVNQANSRRASKTLPRGFSLSQAMADGADSVYGLYGDLLNVRDYECDSTDLARGCQENHKSDPELDTIQYRVGTLDRRVAMKSQRPRSLDLSSWSVTSRASNQTTSSSEGSQKASPNVSRTASFASDTNTSESSWSSNNKSFPKTPQNDKNLKVGKTSKSENAQKNHNNPDGWKRLYPMASDALGT